MTAGPRLGGIAHSKIVIDGAAVERPNPLFRAVDGSDGEVRHDVDALLVGDLRQDPVRVGLGERARVRRDERDLDPVAHALLPEVVVGEERELERRHRALDRHFGDVDHEPAFAHLGERLLHRERAFERVERVHANAHLLGHPLDFLGRARHPSAEIRKSYG